MNAPSQTAPSSFSLTEIKKNAAAQLQKTALPSSAEESWRKIRVDRRANLSPFPSADSTSKISVQSANPAIRFLSFQEAVKDPHLKKIVEKHLKESLAKAGNSQDYFALQNLAEERQSVLLAPEINLKADADKSIRIKHHLQGGNSLIHQVLVCVPDNTELTLIEEFGEEFGKHSKTLKKESQASSKEKALYWNTLTAVHLGQNSSLRYLALRNYSSEDYHFQRFLSEQKRDSRVFYGLAHCGGALGKGFVEARLFEANAEFRGVGIYAGSAHEFHDIEMLADHRHAHTHSSLLYKVVVREQAHSVFDGKLKIEPHTKDVTSHQINHNLLLDSQARAESMPRLIVKAEDVSCEHGATVGMLDPEAVFYLLSRGLDPQEARYLMLEGFLNEAVQEFPLEAEQSEDLLLGFKQKLDML